LLIGTQRGRRNDNYVATGVKPGHALNNLLFVRLCKQKTNKESNKQKLNFCQLLRAKLDKHP